MSSPQSLPINIAGFCCRAMTATFRTSLCTLTLIAACALLVVSMMFACNAPTYHTIRTFQRGNLDREEHPLNEDEVAARFERRRQILQTACKLYGNSSAFRNFEIRTVPLLRYPPVMNVTVGYCPIPKTSTTNWRKIFSSIQEEMKRRNVKGEEVKVPVNERDVLFTFVRDPYSRLFSAYVDKIFSPDPAFWTHTGRYMVWKFRKDASPHSMTCGHNVTFPEYIKYFIQSQHGGWLDYHYIPTHNQCQMCEYPYKYIGHLETIKEDMPFILKAMQSPVHKDEDHDNVTIEENSKFILDKMRTKVTNCISLDEASRRLWKKWQIRGVLHKSQNFPFTEKDTADITAKELRLVAISALSRSGPRSERLGQKKEAMREAFASIPLEDRLQVQKLLFLEFQMFGFDPQPDEVFPKTPFKADPSFSYFDLYR